MKNNTFFLLTLVLFAIYHPGLAQTVKTKQAMTSAARAPLSVYASVADTISELVMLGGQLYFQQSDETYLLSKTEDGSAVRKRKMTDAEYEFARRYFIFEFPAKEEITLTNLISPTADGVAYFVRPSIGGNYIYVNMGAAFPDPVSLKPRTFAHELAHVWQIRHYGIPRYIAEFLNNHVFCKEDPYPYTCNSKKTIDDYNFEQQGGLVEGYYSGKVCETGICQQAFGGATPDDGNLTAHQMLIKNTAHPQKVLDVYGGQSTAGAKIWQYELNQTPAQRFVFQAAGDGYYYLLTVAGNLYVTVDVPPLVVGQPGDVPNTNYGIKQDKLYPAASGPAYTRQHRDQQKWKLIPTGDANTYLLENKRFPGKVLQPENPESKAKVALSANTGSTVQQWYIGRADRSPDQGGGVNYGYWVKNSTTPIRTADELIRRLENAQNGDVIYVADDAVIDLRGRHTDAPVEIKNGVTLASGRGKNGSKGGLIKCSAKDRDVLFRVTGDNVRITGLRIEGPDMTSDGEIEDIVTGVSVKMSTPGAANNILIDNNEVYGWQDVGVSVTNVKNVRILQNEFHHNLFEKLTLIPPDHFGGGYGIEVGDYGGASIEQNVFHHNRHDIAGNGHKESTYSAIKNLVLGGGISHSFDVHAWKENQCENEYKHANGWAIAGHTFLFRDNIFRHDHNEAIQIRGVPVNLVTVQNNSFRMTRRKAVNQFKHCGAKKYLPGVSWVKDEENFSRIKMVGNRYDVRN